MGNSVGGGGIGTPAQLGGVFGQKSSPYLGAVLKGITSGANFQQAQQTPRYLTGSFDPQAYLQQNPDVASVVGAGYMPSAMYHYMNYGINEGRAPNATATSSGPGYLGSALAGKVNTPNYLRQNPDVASAVQSGVFPSGVSHYLRYGLREGRNPTGLDNNYAMPAQWIPPRQAPPGMNPGSSAMPAIQYAQPSQMPWLPQPTAAATPAPVAGATAMPGMSADQSAFYSRYFPTITPANGGWVEGSG